MPDIAEPINWNQVKVIFEDLRGDIEKVAEGVTGLHDKIAVMDATLTTVASDMAIVKPAVQANTRDIAAMRIDIAGMKTAIECIDKRLESVETRPA